MKTPQKFMQNESTEAIRRVINISVSPEEVEVRGGVLYVKTKNPAVKSQIFMYKEKILDELSKRMGSKIREIRF